MSQYEVRDAETNDLLYETDTLDAANGLADDLAGPGPQPRATRVLRVRRTILRDVSVQAASAD